MSAEKEEIIKSLKEYIKITEYLIEFINNSDSENIKTSRINKVAVMLCISDLMDYIIDIETDIYNYIRSLK